MVDDFAHGVLHDELCLQTMAVSLLNVGVQHVIEASETFEVVLEFNEFRSSESCWASNQEVLVCVYLSTISQGM